MPLAIETDSIEIINLLENDSLIYASIINDCELLMQKMENPVIRHKFRDGNNVAHLLGIRKVLREKIMED